MTGGSNNDAIVTLEDTAITVDALANDTDPDGDTLTITQAQVDPAVGQAEIVTIDGKTQIRFTPAANYAGPAVVTYTISDGKGGTDTAVVNITVTPVNDGAGGHRTRRSPSTRTRPTPSRRPTSASPIPTTTPANALAGGEDHDPAGGGHADPQRRRRDRGPGLIPAGTIGHARVHAGRNANGTRLRELHVPGAGRRRHRQRRRRPRPVAEHDRRST